jgi:hypothetical protein
MTRTEPKLLRVLALISRLLTTPRVNRIDCMSGQVTMCAPG